MTVELELHLEGKNADETETALLELQEWLKREPIPKIRIHRKAGTPHPEEQGWLETVLVIALAVQASIPYVKPTFSKVVDAICRWKKNRKKDDVSARLEMIFDSMKENEEEIKELVEEWNEQLKN